MTNHYRVDPRMVPPVVLAMAAGLALLVIEGTTRRGLLLLIILSPFYYLGAEVLARRIAVDDEGITIRKLLRTLRLEWRHIETFDAVRTGRKVFLVLMPFERRPTFITNTIKPFDDLAANLLQRVPDSRITSKAREVLAGPLSKAGPLVQAWVVCLVLTGCVIGRLVGYG